MILERDEAVLDVTSGRWRQPLFIVVKRRLISVRLSAINPGLLYLLNYMLKALEFADELVEACWFIDSCVNSSDHRGSRKKDRDHEHRSKISRNSGAFAPVR